MKTLPEILLSLKGRNFSWDERADKAQEAIAKELMGCLPEKMPEIQMTDYLNGKADGHNSTVDEVRARLTAFIGKEE